MDGDSDRFGPLLFSSVEFDPNFTLLNSGVDNVASSSFALGNAAVGVEVDELHGQAHERFSEVLLIKSVETKIRLSFAEEHVPSQGEDLGFEDVVETVSVFERGFEVGNTGKGIDKGGIAHGESEGEGGEGKEGAGRSG